jgi:hypothetical protein
MNNETKDKFYAFMQYIDDESQQICDELLDAWNEQELGCVYQFASEYIDHYRTQFMAEIYALSKDNAMPAYASLMQRSMHLKAMYCLITQMMKMLEELHPELEKE